MLLVRLPAAGQFPGSDLGLPKFSTNFLLASVSYLQIFLSCQKLIAQLLIRYYRSTVSLTRVIPVTIIIYIHVHVDLPSNEFTPLLLQYIADFYNAQATGLNSFRQFEEKLLFDAVLMIFTTRTPRV